tara:strand:+ start:877 stop:1137 length:261 start_codon:yes stop_codon:yes gene_type:complete
MMDTELPPQCGYNYVYPLKWRTGGYGIGLHTITIINKFAKHRWGWYFEPNKNMNYNDNDWFKNQECIITFEDKWDLTQARLQIKDV